MAEARGFKEVSVSPISVQVGDERVSKNVSERPPPRFAMWRVNLTALSQLHNLYFVAHSAEIYIFQPTFPEQRVPGEPSLILQPPVSRPDLTGTINPARPHCINHLIVGKLGTEEIVLVACDDGDVIAYQTQAVNEAIQRRSEPDCAETVVGADVRPFLIVNVGRSAWGLAVHTEARMIAVSANTHQVTVFAYALARGSETARNEGFSRDQDHFIRLPPMQNNIPTIAFCNTGADPDGRWLLAGDIEGKTCLFDVHEHKLVKVILGAYCVKPSFGCRCVTRGAYPHSVWGVMWLDRRSFRRTKSSRGYEVLGSREADFDEPVAMHDISTTRNDVLDSSVLYRGTSHGGSVESDVIPEVEGVQLPEGAVWVNDGDFNHYGDVEDSELEEEEVMERRVVQTKQPSMEVISVHTPKVAIPRCPILQVSAKDVFLLQGCGETPGNGHWRPATVLHDPLYQHIPDSHPGLPFALHWLDDSDRMNMHAQIPELGVVVVASPKGRAAVLSLTKTSPDVQRGHTCYFRLDHILPFRSQEERDERPKTWLMGIAVGPVQGMLSGRRTKVRRWRLLMMYMDHSTLSYELGKDGDQDEGVQVLVV